MSSVAAILPASLFDVYVMDLDGTVYLGDQLLPAALETILALRKLEKRLIFITNEASRTRQTIIEKLAGLGIPTSMEEVINSSLVTVDYLKQNHPKASLFVIGEPPLCAELQQAGFRLVESHAEIDVVVVSTDKRFDYPKLRTAFKAIKRGAAFISTNADRTYPLVSGEEEPDAGAIIAAIEACTGHPLDVMVGKPSLFMAEAALKIAGVPAQDCLLVGDNLETDIRMGRDAGMQTALVTTGVSRADRLAESPLQPDYILNKLFDLLPEGFR
jgi:HAD superfamily hydrolase (TIGR01457 family)